MWPEREGEGASSSQQGNSAHCHTIFFLPFVIPPLLRARCRCILPPGDGFPMPRKQYHSLGPSTAPLPRVRELFKCKMAPPPAFAPWGSVSPLLQARRGRTPPVAPSRMPTRAYFGWLNSQLRPRPSSSRGSAAAAGEAATLRPDADAAAPGSPTRRATSADLDEVGLSNSYPDVFIII